MCIMSFLVVYFACHFSKSVCFQCYIYNVYCSTVYKMLFISWRNKSKSTYDLAYTKDVFRNFHQQNTIFKSFQNHVGIKAAYQLILEIGKTITCKRLFLLEFNIILKNFLECT